MQFIETTSSPQALTFTGSRGLSGRDQDRRSTLNRGIVQRLLIALLLCLGLSSLATNAQAQFVKVVTGYLLPGQTNVFFPRVPGNTSQDTIYEISGVYSVSGRLVIQEGAEVSFLPNSRIVDSSGGKIIANGFAGLQRRIYMHGQPVNSNSVEWGHFLILPGADSTFFANVHFSNFRKLNTVDKLYLYGPTPTGLTYANEIMKVSNGTGAIIATFSAKTYIYDAVVDSCVALYRGGAFAFLQAPSQSYFPADDGRLALANSQVRRLLIRDTHVMDTNASVAPGTLWNTTNAFGGAIYMSARIGATSGNYIAGYLGNRPGPFFPANQDTLVFERCNAVNTLNASGAFARGGAIYVGSYTGLTVSQASFNTDSAIAAYNTNGAQQNAWGGAIAVSGTSGSPFFVPPPAPGFDRLPGLAIIKRANFNGCVAGYGGAINMDYAFGSAPVLNIDGENFVPSMSSPVRDSGLISFNGNVAYYEGGAIFTNWYTYVTGYLAPKIGVYDLVNQVQVPASKVELRVKFFNNVAGIGGGSIFLDPFNNNTNPDIQNRRVWHEGNSVNPRDPRINRPDLATFVLGGGAEFIGLRDSSFAVEYHNNFTMGGNGGAVCINGPQGSLPPTAFNRYFVWDKYNASNTTIEPLPFDQRELTRFCDNSAYLGTAADSTTLLNRAGRGGAVYIRVSNPTDPILAQDSTYFVRVRIERNNAFTGSAIHSDNYNMRLVSNLTLIANNHTTSPFSYTTDLNSLLGNPGDSNASATIWGEWEGSLPGYETNSRGNAVYDNVARYIVRLPSSPGVGFGGTDTLRGNFWGETGPDVITKLPSGALQRTFFIDYYRQGCVSNVYEPNRAPQQPYAAITVGTIPDTLLMEGRVYDIFDKGTDIKTADYGVRRLAIQEDFALGEPTDIGYGNSNPSLDHHGLHRFTRDIFDTNAVYVNKIMTMQTDFVGPHPIGYPLFLQADIDTNDANRDHCARNYTVLYVINTTTNEFVRVNAKETVVDEATGQVAKYQGRLDFVPDSSVAHRHAPQRAKVLWTLSLLRPLTAPATFAEIQRAAMLEDSAALDGRIYTLDPAEYTGAGADSVCTQGITTATPWYAGERYHTLPVRPGDQILVISRTQLWKYGAAGAIARGLQFPIGDVLPPQFTSDVATLQNDPINPNNKFIREDVNYDGAANILFRVAGYDRNNFYDPRFLFNPFNYTQLQFKLAGYKTLADSNNTRLAWWLRDTTLYNVNVSGSNGYVLLKGQPHNPDVVPSGEPVTITMTNYPPNTISEGGLLGNGWDLGPDSLHLSMWTFPPFLNCPTGFQKDTLCVRSTSSTYTFRIFVQDSLPVFTSSPSLACAANLTDSLRYSYDIQTDDETEDSTAGAVTSAWAGNDPTKHAFDFRYGKTSYKYMVAPVWMRYAYNQSLANQTAFITKGQINVRLDSATVYPMITPTPQVNGELNLDTIVAVQADDGHSGLTQQRWRLPVNVEPHIITDTLPWAKEDVDYSLDFHDPNNVPRIQITDANFADFHTYQLIYKGTTDTVYRDAHFKTGQAIIVGTTPTWLHIDPNSGILTGTPSITDAPHNRFSSCQGADTVEVVVQDQCGLTAWKSFELNVDSTNHLPRFYRGPHTFCVLNKQQFCDSVVVTDRDLLRPICTETLTLTSLDSNFTVTPATINGMTSDTQTVAVCGKFNLDDTYFSQNPPPPQYIRLKVTDKAGNFDTLTYRIYVGDQPTFECAIYVSNIGTTTHPTDVQRLCFGAGRFGTDSLDVRYCEFEEPPPGPSAVFDSRWELPIGGSLKGTYLDIRRDTAQYTTVTWQVRFQSGADAGTFLFPIHICWRTSCLDSTGSFVGNFYLQDPFNPNEFSINMRTGQGPINPSFYTLMKVGADSLCLEIRNVQLANARIVFVPSKSAVETASAQPKEFALEQNYPNPFNPSTTLNFTVAKRSDVRIEIYDLKGSLVRTLVNEQLTAGSYPVMWDGADAAGNVMPSGTYVAKMTAGTYTSTIKMTLKK